jgi:hypothetical protein
MNITDQEVYHGIVCQKIIKQVEGLGYNSGVKFLSGTSKNSLIIETQTGEQVGLYVKYTKKNYSPWAFSFHREHQEEIKILNELCVEALIAFVCGRDGIPLITYDELKNLLDENFEDSERVSISRKPNGNYWLKGRDGNLKKSVTTSDLGKKIFSKLIKN